MTQDDNPFRPPTGPSVAAESAGAEFPASDGAPPTSARWIVLGWLCLAMAFAYLGRVVASVASTNIRSDLDIDLVAMGGAMSAFFWAYALAQVPVGWLCHAWGARRTLALSAVVWSMACALIGVSHDLTTLFLAQMLFGAAQAGVVPCAADAVGQWIPTTRRAFAMGSLGSFMSVGGAAGVALAGMWLAPLGWRGVYVAFAVPGLLWAVGFAIWFRNRPEEHRGVNGTELALIRGGQQKPAAMSAFVPWGRVLTSGNLWLIFGQQFFRAAGYVFFTTWFATYLKETFHVTTKQSGLLGSLPLLAVVAGGFLGGWLVDAIWNATGSRRLSRQGVGIGAMLGCAAFTLAAFFVTSVEPATLLITAGSFCAALGGASGYTATIDKAGPYVAPIFAVMNMVGNFGAALCPLVMAAFVKATGRWSLALLLFAGIYVSAAICWLLLNPEGSFADEEGR